jgi:hypothetical protein
MRETCLDSPHTARPVRAHLAASRALAVSSEYLWPAVRALTCVLLLWSAPAASAQAGDADAGSFPSSRLGAPGPEGRTYNRGIEEEDQDLAPENIPSPPDKTLTPAHKNQLGKRKLDSLAPRGGWAWERSQEPSGERSGDSSGGFTDDDR